MDVCADLGLKLGPYIAAPSVGTLPRPRHPAPQGPPAEVNVGGVEPQPDFLCVYVGGWWRLYAAEGRLVSLLSTHKWVVFFIFCLTERHFLVGWWVIVLNFLGPHYVPRNVVVRGGIFRCVRGWGATKKKISLLCAAFYSSCF